MRDTLPLEDLPRRHQNNFTIQPERAMIDIPQIEEKSLLPIRGISSIHLRPPGQAGRYQMPTVLLRTIVWEVVHAERSRAYEAHLAFQDVEESRKFIQAGAAHPLAESCESILVGQELPVGSAGIGHRTEFICLKGLLVKPRTFLHEQQRPPVKNPCRQGRESDDRKKKRTQADSDHQVEGALRREESCDRRFGRGNHRVHTGVTMCTTWCAVQSWDHQRIRTKVRLRFTMTITGKEIGRLNAVYPWFSSLDQRRILRVINNNAIAVEPTPQR